MKNNGEREIIRSKPQTLDESYDWVEAFDSFPGLGIKSYFPMSKKDYDMDPTREKTITINSLDEICNRIDQSE